MNRTLTALTIAMLGFGAVARAGTEMAEPPEAPPPAGSGYYYPSPFKVSSDLRQYAVGAHVEIFGGANLFQSGRFEVSSPQVPGFTTSVSTKDELGGVGGVKIGYTWYGFDKQTDADGNLIKSINGDFAVLPSLDYEMFWTGYKYKADGSVDGNPTELRSDVNAYVFSLDPTIKFQCDMFRPYFGAGVGGAYITSDSTTANIGGGTVNAAQGSTDFCFAVQALAGTQIFVAKDWVLTFDYKFLDFVSPTFNSDGNNTTPGVHYRSGGIGQQIVTAGVGYYF